MISYKSLTTRLIVMLNVALKSRLHAMSILSTSHTRRRNSGGL